MSVTSTIDRIKDTTIMRMIRKMAGVIDEQTADVKAVNDKLDNFNLDGVKTQLAKNTSDIGQLKISDNEHTTEITTLESNVDNHAREITAIKAVDAKQTSDISEMNTVVDALTKELPTEITLYRDGEGKIKAQVTKEDNTTFDSNVLDMIIPYQYDIISGTSARSFKLDITTSDGNHIITNDFLIPEGGGTDVSITSVTLQKDPNNANKIKVSIGLSDGTPLESGYATMVNSVSGSFVNNKLTITVNGVSSVPITIDTTGTVYSPGTGIKIASGTISIDDTIVALKSDISDMETKTRANATFETKTNASATYATKTAVNTLQNEVGDAFTAVAIGTDGKSLDFTALDGQVNNIVLPSSGGQSSDEWEEIDLTNFPSDWVSGDYIKLYPKIDAVITTSVSSWSSSLSSVNLTLSSSLKTTPEVLVKLASTYAEIGYLIEMHTNYGLVYQLGLAASNLNSDSPGRIAATIIMFNGGSVTKSASKFIKKSEMKTYFSAIYRKRINN